MVKLKMFEIILAFQRYRTISDHMVPSSLKMRNRLIGKLKNKRIFPTELYLIISKLCFGLNQILRYFLTELSFFSLIYNPGGRIQFNKNDRFLT